MFIIASLSKILSVELHHVDKHEVYDYLSAHKQEFGIAGEFDSNAAINALQTVLAQRKTLESMLQQVMTKAGVISSMSDVYTNPDNVLNQLYAKLETSNNYEKLTTKLAEVENQLKAYENTLVEPQVLVENPEL